MHISEDANANLRLRSKRHEGGQKVYHIRLDPQCEAALKAIKQAYDSPTDPLDVVSTPLMIKRAIRFYKQYALRPESRAIEFKEIREGAGIPDRKDRHRHPMKPRAV